MSAGAIGRPAHQQRERADKEDNSGDAQVLDREKCADTDHKDRQTAGSGGGARRKAQVNADEVWHQCGRGRGRA